ncbi:uncharacterized protein LOC122506310 [Leptopilina heterotoma]|uniref:uncharacterized protein LOC122506310 n=1 Tax=Leptopilina heterotoma TaxID=63436 RepID=UPI001CA94E22|nr:uncharacterized protein LOC122506310 [Leptopilina heterotoma]
MTSEDAEIEIPPQELIPFEFYKLPGEDSDGYSTEEEYTPPIDRVSAILEYLRLDHLNKDEKEHVTQIIKEFPDSFHLPGEQLTPTNMVQHKIITKDEIPIHVKQYRFSPTQKEEIDKVIDRMKSEGAIDSSCSPYNSPLLIIPKKIDGSGKKKWRIVIDFRALNEKTIGDCYPLPNITAILDTIGGAQYFSVFDLASGFHQIELDPNDRSKTAFSTTHGHYEYIRMPMGLKNSPSTFQRLMDQVLTGLQGVELFVYLDDIVVYANDLEEHGKKVRRLLQRLKGANLSLQPEKCEFLFKEVAYLGHIISSEGVKPNPKTVEAVKNFPTPKTPRNIKQFLGLAGYYRRFIKDFSAKAKPLSNLLKKDVKFEWKQEQEASFKELREALCTNPILQYPDYEKPFTLTTDASDFAIGAVLSQEKDGFDLPIAYLSRVLNAPELNYSTTEKECLAVLYAVHHFRPYIYGKKFTLVSDHEPLRWIATIKDPGQRLIRWRLKLRDYEYEFQHKSGKLNTNADALSRNVIEDEINENSQINVDQKQVKILINKRVDKIPKKPTKPSTTALSNPQKSKIQPPKSILKPSTLKSTLEHSTIGSRLAQRRAAQQSTLKSTLDQNTTGSRLTQRQALQPSTSKSNFNQSTIGSRVAQRRALQPRVKTIDEESIDSSTDEEREIPIPPIQKASRSLLPSLKLPPAALKNIPGPKSAPPQIQPKVVNFPIPETTVITIEPPVSESEESSDEEEANAMNLSRKEIAKDLGNSISRFNEYVKQHEDWLIDSPQSPRNWLTLSDGNDDESIHKAANELIPGDHTEFSQKLDFQWDYAKGESMWEDKQINNSNNETFTKKVVNPEETIHLTPKKAHTDINKNKNVTFRSTSSEPNTPVVFKTPKAMSTPYHTSLHEIDVESDDETDEKDETDIESNDETDEEKETDEEEESDTTENEIEENKTKSNSITTTLLESIPPNLPSCYSRIPEKPSNITSHRENLTYHRNNYVHFLSADCEFTTPISRLLIDIAVIDPEEIKSKKPIKGQILVTPRGRHNVYSVIVKDNYYDLLLKEDIISGIRNLKILLYKEKAKEIRISRHGDFTDELMKGELMQMIESIFYNSNINVTICHGQVSVPKEENREDIISEFHKSKIAGHKGIVKTYRRIREKFYWPRIKEQVTEFVRRCPTCQTQKLVRAKTREPMIITDTPLDVFDKVSLDTVGKLPTTPDGNCHILTMQDHLSKYCIAVPIPDISATTIAHAVAKELFSVYGAPKVILTDKGTSFIGKLMSKLSKIFKVKQVTTSGYRPQTNGALERSHAVLADYIKQYATDCDDWDRLLPFAMFAYNTSVHEATNFTPYELVFGKTARTPSSFPQEEKLETYGSYLTELINRLIEIRILAAKNLIDSKTKSKERYDKSIKPFLGKIGDKAYVLIEGMKRKFDPHYHGPYTIVDILDKNNMSESIIFTPPIQGELVRNYVFPKGNIDNINYPKGILEELTAEYNLDKPTYTVDRTTGPELGRLWRVKCIVTDNKNSNAFIATGDSCRTIRESEHSAAKIILKELDKTYYFSEEEKPRSLKHKIHVMTHEEPSLIKLKLYKWENCCEYCYKRGHTKDHCYSVIRNKKILNKQNPFNDKDNDSDDFWDIPGPTCSWD